MYVNHSDDVSCYSGQLRIIHDMQVSMTSLLHNSESTAKLHC
jgi:hypothetical protein